MNRLGWLAILALCSCGNGGDGDSLPDAGPRPDALSTTCNVLATDNCTTNASRPKCSVTEDDGALTTGCVALNGSRVAGETCTRGTGTGNDDCDKKLFCSGLAVEIVAGSDPPIPVSRICRSYCVDETTCAAGERCTTLLREPRVGLCVPAGCALFSEGCPSGTTCDAFVHFDAASFISICRALGPVPIGGDCSARDCAANARCFALSASDLRCVAHCDDMHMCTTGSTCMPFTGLPAGAGLCL